MIAIAYFAIATFVLTALRGSGQLRSNRLGLATGMIFLSCAFGHLGHFAMHAAPLLAAADSPAGRVANVLFQCSLAPLAGTVIAPIAGSGNVTSFASYSLPLTGIDVATAMIGVWYLTLRRHYNKLLDAPSAGLFDDERAVRRAEELTEQRAAALEAYQQKSRFLANMSHEIRTPLNGVLGMAELLRGTDLDDRQRRFVSTLVNSGEQLMAIVDEVLDLARIESGRLVMHDDVFDVHGMFEHVRQLFEPRAIANGTALAVHLDKSVPRQLRGDGGRLRQVVSNLVANAIKFTEQGAIHVTAAAEHTDDGAVSLRCSVRDSGIGIAQKHLRDLFDPYVQADTGNGSDYGGTGLGLAVCRELVGLMGGGIHVDSAVGVGTTFTFHVELRDAATNGERTSAATAGPSAAPATPRPARGDQRVLVVDDNAVNREIAVETLRWLGFDATAVDDGAGALDAMNGTAWDVVLMDCQMPVLDGYETTRRIRARHDDSGCVTVIAMTAATDPDQRQRCRDAGMDDVLIKPVTPATLSRVLRAYGLTPTRSLSEAGRA